MGEGAVTVERVFDAPADLVWALLSDTNRYDRALGLAAPRYSWQEVEGRRQLVGAAQQGGLSMEWIEDPYEWVEGASLSSRRRFLKGPASVGGLRLSVEALDGNRAKATLSAYGSLKSLALRAIGPLVRAGLRRRIEAYFDAVQELATGTENPEGKGPPAAEAQHLLWSCEQALLSGRATDANTTELDRRARDLSGFGVEGGLRERIIETLRRRPDEEVTQMRPFELADAWSIPRSDVLRGFLHATSAGLVDLNWQVNCPVCKVAAGVARSLSEVAQDVHCEACNIRYDIDFGANVEAVFRCNEAIRPVVPTVYCAASPSFRPHVLAQLHVAPRQRRTVSLRLSDADLNIRTLGKHKAGRTSGEAPPQSVRVTVLDDRVEVEAEGTVAPGASTEVSIESRSDEEVHLLIERAGWSAPVALGSVVASMPEFVDLFATEAPAAGLELTIKRVTFLFSDLTGSTALYERIGDARAYAVVQDHFRLMESVVAKHGGAIVKTMGDAVMATFTRPDHAVAAACEAIDATVEENEKLEIGIKLGVHEGPCLAVRANDRLDFFGTTVNVAARLQGQAGTSELVVARALTDQAAVARLLERHEFRDFETGLKGIAAEQALRAYDLASGR